MSFNPFLSFSKQLKQLLQSAAQKKDAATWLYQNEARTLFFMLEALTRIHHRAFDEKLFDKWNRKFKKMEDLFGKIDQYDALSRQFKSNKNVTKEQVNYFELQRNKYIEKLNRRLADKNWFSEKMENFERAIREIEFPFDAAYRSQLKLALRSEMSELLEFVSDKNYRFSQLESEIHEIRRKLRWFSIYVKAFNGLIQLKNTSQKQNTSIYYFTKNVLQSPYNKVPKKPAQIACLYYNRSSFLALSWMIEQLGERKDKGLDIFYLQKAIRQTDKVSKKEALEKAIESLNYPGDIEKQILDESSHLLKTFFVTDKMPQKLIA